MVQIHVGPCFSYRTNRTHLKYDFCAVGALNKGRSTVADYDDDLLGFLGVESISDVTFFSRVQIADAVFHSRAYKRVSRRNNYTIANTGNEAASVMVKLKCFLLPEMKGEWFVGRLFLQCQCLVDTSVNGMTFWGVLSATLSVFTIQTGADLLLSLSMRLLMCVFT